MPNDFTTLSFKIDIADAEQKIANLTRGLGSVETRAKNVAKGIAAAFGTLRTSDMRFRASRELEETNSIIQKMRSEMEAAAKTAKQASAAINKSFDLETGTAQLAALKQAKDALAGVDAELQALLAKYKGMPDALPNLIPDQAALKAQMQILEDFRLKIKDAFMAGDVKKSPFNPRELSKIKMPQLFDEDAAKGMPIAAKSLAWMRTALSEMTIPINELRQLLPELAGAMGLISDSSMQFTNVMGLASAFKSFDETGKSGGIDKFLEAVRQLEKLDLATPDGDRGTKNTKDQTLFQLRDNLEKMHMAALEWAADQANWVPLGVYPDFDKDSLLLLSNDIRAAIPALEKRLVDEGAFVKIPATIDTAGINVDGVKERAGEIKTAIDDVIQSSQAVSGQAIAIPFAPKPPSRESIDAIIRDIRAYLRGVSIRLPSFTAVRPSKEALDAVLSETRKIIDERALRITNVELVRPSKDKIARFVRDVQAEIDANKPVMRIAGMADSAIIREELRGITGDLKELAAAAKIPGVPDDVLKSLESYGKELRSIARAMDTIQKLRSTTAAAARQEAKAMEKAQSRSRSDVQKGIDAAKEEGKAQAEAAKAQADALFAVAKARVDSLEQVREMKAKPEDREFPIAETAVEAIKAVEDVRKKIDIGVRNAGNYSKEMDAFKRSIGDVRPVAMTTAEAVRQIGLDPDSAIDPLKKLRAELKMTDSAALNLARSMGVFVSGSTVIRFFRDATRKANAFGLELRKIQSIAEEYDYSKLSRGLMEIDSRLGNAIANASTLYWAYSSGVRGTEQELVKFTETMAKTALTIQANVTPTMGAATSLMNAYGLAARDATEVADLMFMIVKEGKAYGEALASSFGHVVATAASMGVTLNELGAATAVLTRTIRTSRALTYLNNILGKMINPAENVRQAAERLGVDFSITAVKAKGFTQVMRELHAATGGNAEAIAQLFPDLRGQRAAITLLSTQFGEFENQLENFRGKAGSMQKAYEAIADTPEMQLRSMRNTLYKIAIEAGKTANEFWTLGGAVEPVIEAFNSMSAEGKSFAGRMAASGAAMVGMAVAQRAFAAAQYASAQAAIQSNMLDMEAAKNKLKAAESTRQQALQLKELEVAQIDADLARRQAAGTLLFELNQEKESLSLQEQKIKGLMTELKVRQGISGLAAKMTFDPLLADVARMNEMLAQLQEILNKSRFSAENTATRFNADLYAAISAQSTAMGKGISVKEAELNIRLNDENLRQMREIAAARLKIANLKAEDEQANWREIAALEELVSDTYHQLKVSAGVMNSKEKESILNQRLVKTSLDLAASRYKEADSVGQRLSAGRAFERALASEIVRLKDGLEVQKKALASQMQGADTLQRQQAAAEAIALANQLHIVQEAKASNAVDITNEKTRQNIGLMESRRDILAASAGELKKAIAVETTNNAHLVANAEAANKAITVDNARAGAAHAAAAAIDIEAQATRQLSSLDKLNAEEKAALAATYTDAERNIANAHKNTAKSAQDATAATDALLKKQRELSVFGVGRKVAGKGGAGLGWADVGMYGGMLAGRGLAAAMGPGAAMLSMLPMKKMLTTAAQAIGTLSAATSKLTISAAAMRTRGLIPSSAAINALTVRTLKSSAATLFAANAENKLAISRTAAWAVAGPAALAVTALATAVGFLLTKTSRGGPMAGIAESMMGINGLEKEQDSIDAAVRIYEERKERAADQVHLSRQVLWANQAEVRVARERVASLRRAGAAQDAINAAQRELGRAQADYAAETERQRNVVKMVEAARSVQNRITQAQKAVKKAEEEYNKERQKAVSVAAAQLAAADANTTLFLELADGGYYTAETKASSRAKDAVGMARRNLEEAKKELEKIDRLRAELLRNEGISLKNRMKFDKETIFIQMRTAAEQSEIYARRAEVARRMFNDAQKGYNADRLLRDVETARAEVETLRLQDGKEKELEAAQKALDAAEKARKEAPQKLLDAHKNYMASVNDFLNSIPKQIQESIQERNKRADYEAIFRGEGTRLEAAFKNLDDARRHEQTVAAGLKDIQRELGATPEALAAHNEAVKKARDMRWEQEKELNSQLTRLADAVGRTQESISQKMKAIADRRFERMVETPATAFSPAQMNKMAASGKNPIAVLVGRWNKVIMADAKAYSDKYEAAMQKARKSADDAERATATQEAYDALMKWDSAMTQTTDNLKRLADAERDANAEAYNMASQLNKAFKATAQAGVKAQSVEAVRLMSRSFDTPVQPKQENAMQQKLLAAITRIENEAAGKLRDMQGILSGLQASYSRAGSNILNGSSAIKTAGASFKTAADTFSNSLRNLPTTRLEVVRVY